MGGGRTNTWDSQNRLVQCAYNGTTTTSTYASGGLRHRSVVGANTTDYVLDQSIFVRELLSGMVKATYLVGPRGPEYRRDDQAGAIRWDDGLGSVVGEVAPDGTLTRSQSFDVYGCVRTSSGAATTKHKFVGSLGHPSDDETGLIYMRARHYDPVCGRFASEDPGRDGRSWYVYCDSNPTNLVDATGRDAVFWTLVAQIAFIAGSILLAGFYRFGLGVYQYFKGVQLKLQAKAAGGGSWSTEEIIAAMNGGDALIAKGVESMFRGAMVAAVAIAIVTTILVGLFVELINHPEWG
jgi:RHS repeat-associated protein